MSTQKKYRSKKRTQAYRAPAKANPRRRAQPRTERISKQLAVKIPDCSVHYINALFDPFEALSGVCVPADSFPMPSQKVKVFNRGTFNIGQDGFGVIVFAPAPWNNIQCISATTGASVGGAATPFNTFTALGGGFFTKLPYSDADRAANTVQARVVAAGIRVRYAGREDSRQGLYVGFEEPDLLNISAYSFNSVRLENSSSTRRPTGDGYWDQSVCYSGPVSPQCVEFTNLQNPISSVGTGTGSPICIALQGGSGDPIEYEAVIHVEYIGSKVPGKTASHADSATYGKVLQTTKEMGAIAPIQPERKQTGFQKFIAFVKEAAPQLISAAGQAVGALVTKNPRLAMGAATTASQLFLQQAPREQVMTRTQRMIMA